MSASTPDGRARLVLIRGGLADELEPLADREWREFCGRIGWREPAARSVEDDVSRLAARIVVEQERVQSSLEVATSPIPCRRVARARAPWRTALPVLALAAAVAAAWLSGAAAYSWGRGAAAAAWPSARPEPAPPAPSVAAPPASVDAEPEAAPSALPRPGPAPHTSPPGARVVRVARHHGGQRVEPRSDDAAQETPSPAPLAEAAAPVELTVASQPELPDREPSVEPSRVSYARSGPDLGASLPSVAVGRARATRALPSFALPMEGDRPIGVSVAPGRDGERLPAGVGFVAQLDVGRAFGSL